MMGKTNGSSAKDALYRIKKCKTRIKAALVLVLAIRPGPETV
jgi:hypothetical protein